MKKATAVVFASFFFLLSCSKQAADVSQPDLSKPKIKLIYPQDVPVLPPGFPLCIKVQVSDDSDLSAVWMEIDDGNGYRRNFTVTGKSIEIIEKYTAPAGVTGEFTAKFFAIDETGNESSLAVKFFVEN